VLGEMRGGVDHLAGGAAGRLLRRARVVGQLHKLAPALAVELAEPGALGRIAYDDEPPALAVAAAGRADGGIHDLPQERLRDRLRLETAHGPLRGDDIEEIHGYIPLAAGIRPRSGGDADQEATMSARVSGVVAAVVLLVVATAAQA